MAHNQKMLDTQDKERQICECKKQECLVNGSCLIKSLIYKATVITENQTKFCVGSTGLSSRITTQSTDTASNMKNIAMQHLYHSIF